MANYQTIVRLRPSFAPFIIHEQMVHRGDTLFFPANKRGAHFTTDGRGFRHTSFGGENLSVAEITRRSRYGLVLGTSRAFGLGLSGNENTIASLLSQRFGFPFANVALPQGNSRNLSSMLFAILSRAKHPPAAVVHFSTGDFTGFSFTSVCDPIFGSPNTKLMDIYYKEHGGVPPPERSLEAMLNFTSVWTRSVASLCRGAGAPLVLAHDSSFFEKRYPSQWDIDCELGKPFVKLDKRWFAGHKAFSQRFYARREGLADRLGIALAGPGPSNQLGFIDEFHYDEDGTREMTQDLGDALEPQLKS